MRPPTTLVRPPADARNIPYLRVMDYVSGRGEASTYLPFHHCVQSPPRVFVLPSLIFTTYTDEERGMRNESTERRYREDEFAVHVPVCSTIQRFNADATERRRALAQTNASEAREAAPAVIYRDLSAR